jgi:DNA-binding transcriptional MerR regulator
MTEDKDMDVSEEARENTSYFQEWYGQNGEALNTSRRDRYNSDPEYREKVLAQNRVARKKKRDAARLERAAQKEARKVAPTRSWKTVDVEVVDGAGTKIVKMFTIGAVAAALDCSTGALRLWASKGVIEETPHRYTKGDRLYTLEQIEAYKVKLTALGRIGPNKSVINTLPYVERRVLLDGRKRTRKLRLFKIGALAKMVGRTVNTVENLARKGYLPETPFRATEAGSRLYTLGMIEAVKDAFDSRHGMVRGTGEWDSMFSEITDSWRSAGIVGAKIMEEGQND